MKTTSTEALDRAAYYIEKLGLESHVEGGAFKEVYRSQLVIPGNVLPQQFHGDRHAGTMIYFLLKHGQFSAFHRIASDEGWHFYDGAPLTVYEIRPDGMLHTHHLGRNLEAEENFYCTIKAGSWFGSRCNVPGGFSLVGCTVAPGFDFADFELGDREVLSAAFPEHRELIASLT